MVDGQSSQGSTITQGRLGGEMTIEWKRGGFIKNREKMFLKNNLETNIKKTTRREVIQLT
jgi:hypothetical protein